MTMFACGCQKAQRSSEMEEKLCRESASEAESAVPALQADQTYPRPLARTHRSGKPPSHIGSPMKDRGRWDHLRPESIHVLEFGEKGDKCLDLQLKQHTRMYQAYQGQLKLSVYVNSGLLTMHVIQARQLNCAYCDAYVKLALVPDDTHRARCKTQTIRNNHQPIFDEKFSFELLEEDMKKRLVISVVHRPGDSKLCRGILLGCMSFGVRHIINQKTVVSGWYYLLSESVGRYKHLLDTQSSPVTVNGAVSLKGLQPSADRTIVMETHKVCVVRSGQGYGFTVTAGRPAHVYTVEADSPASRAGLMSDDTIVAVNEHAVSMLSADTVAKVIRLCEKSVLLEVQRIRCEKPLSERPRTHTPRRPGSRRANARPSSARLDSTGRSSAGLSSAEPSSTGVSSAEPSSAGVASSGVESGAAWTSDADDDWSTDDS